MAYDEDLADQVRGLLLEREEALDEKAMFGGLGFMVHGNLAIAVSGRGGLMVRIDPADAEELVKADGVERMEMGGRKMDGWLRVDAGPDSDDAELAPWVERALAFVATLD